MAIVRWRLAEFLKEHDITPYRLAQTLESETRANTIYRLARQGDEPSRVDLSTLGTVMEGLAQLVGRPITFEDILAFTPSESDQETRAILEDHPDILERIQRLERGQTKLIPWSRVKARRAAV